MQPIAQPTRDEMHAVPPVVVRHEDALDERIVVAPPESLLRAVPGLPLELDLHLAERGVFAQLGAQPQGRVASSIDSAGESP